VVLPARHARAAGPAAALVAVFVVAVTVGPTANTEVNDLYLYRSMTSLVRDGLVPYHDWAFEYPPLAIVPIALGGAFGVGEGVYPVTFAVLMLLCLLALQGWVRGVAGPRAAWAVVAAPLLLGAMLRTHYDLVPAAIVAGALLLFARGRTTWAFAVLGAGTATKLFPALLVPLAVAWLLGRGERDRVLPGLGAFAAVVVACAAPFVGSGFAEQFRFHLERPVQIESTPATVLSALGRSEVTGTDARPDRFKSNGLDGGPADAVALLFSALFALVYLAVARLALRGGDVRRLALLGLAAVVAFVALGKVLSPQFMIWLLPFAALAWAWGDRAIAALCALAAVLTRLWFPGRYFDVVAQEPLPVALVGLRNGVLLALLAVTLATVAGRPRRRWPSAGRPRSAPARP
jgi:hypothetical protein